MRSLGSREALIGATWVLLSCSGDIHTQDGDPGGTRGPGGPGIDGSGNAPGGPGSGPGANAGSGSNAGGTGGSGATPPGAFVASPSVARRLSRAELDNTFRDMLGDDSRSANRLLPEDLYAPYDNDYPSQTASGALIDSLEALAGDVAPRVVADPALRARLVPCTPSSAGDADCFREVVHGLLQRAYRRPVQDSEVDPYLTLLDFATEDNPDVPHDFYTAVELLVRSVLQDPEFLYRIEIGTATSDGGVFALNDHEIATRLSYLLWGSAPDDELLGDADAGRLTDADERVAIARRMLADDRARDQLHRFHAMWLGYRAIPHSAELTGAFHRETSALIDRVVFDEPQSYLNLFTLAETYLDDTLADHYGLPHPSGGEGWVDYGASNRAGILSHGSVLSAFSKFSDTSPTQRGIMVRTRLLCQEIPRPPANVNSDEPPGDMAAVCKYDRYAEHRSSSSCASCHNQMDPIGFGLENYDVAGRYREHDDGLPQCTIAGQGEVVGYGEFSGPAELGQLLIDEELLQPCVVEQLLQFAIGRAPEGDETAELSTLQAAFADQGFALDELILTYVGSDAFALRMEPEDP